MPQRFLRPGITTSKNFNSCGWISQVFYIRLLTLVDDFGRYEADRRLLRSHAFPIGDEKGDDVELTTIDNICAQMSANKLVQFYVVEGKEYLQVLRWQERVRASHSKFPEPCGHLTTFDNKCSPPSSSPPPSPEAIATTPSPMPPQMCECNIDDAVKIGARLIPPCPESRISEWWHSRDSVGWVSAKGHPIRKWESDLRGWWSTLQHRQHEQTALRKNGSYNPTTTADDYAPAKIAPENTGFIDLQAIAKAAREQRDREESGCR